MEWWSVVAFALSILFIFYTLSQTLRYYIRITFYYFCIFLHAIVCNVIMIPSWIAGSGADVIFHTFKYWLDWTGTNFEVRGYKENLEHMNIPAVVICNHQSALDVTVMTRVFPPRGIVMMKESLKYAPFFNVSALFARTIFVKRDTRSNSSQVVDRCVDELKNSNLKLWVYPEGTRNRDGGILPFKKGAFNIAIRGAFPIVPIVVSDYRPFYSRQERYFKSDGEVIIRVLPAVSTKGPKCVKCSPYLSLHLYHLSSR
ncbi:unnamed protein product [Nippostrongylus brasiliensis]|uniref:1-acyl-sn-glycerol-3-phosphate acyltransferase n=1 Tax=Nippostrongylus brasiliensis TaxID=27835 RepID=A0A0N4Y898_NIPBR|nr:unnamed protein product [Nippostrongylus brasiliensis]